MEDLLGLHEIGLSSLADWESVEQAYVRTVLLPVIWQMFTLSELTGKKANFPFDSEICSSDHSLNCLFLEK